MARIWRRFWRQDILRQAHDYIYVTLFRLLKRVTRYIDARAAYADFRASITITPQG